MAQDRYEEWSSEPESYTVKVRMTGTGAAAPTKNCGKDITITRTAAGVYKLTFGESPGAFVGIDGDALQADTPGNVKNFSITWNVWNVTTKSIELSLWNAAGAATDLAAAQYISAAISFKKTSVSG
jgi:hypothetical protein